MEEEISYLNIMEDTHRNFNSYEIESASNQEEKYLKTPKLFLKNVNIEMTENGLMNYCSQFGRVRSISIKSNYSFVTYLTIR